MKPWTDRTGKFLPLKAAVFAGTFVPVVLLAYYATAEFWQGGLNGSLLGPLPYVAAILFTGDWAIRFLWISLAVTPLRRISQWPKLIMVRRMLGIAALSYAVGHLVLYFFAMHCDVLKVVSEIALRPYLTVGFFALLGLVALGATSMDAAVRRLGKNWNLLHKTVYGIGILSALHYLMQTEDDFYQSSLMAGFFVLLMLYRLAHWRGLSLFSSWVLLGIAITTALLTVLIEASWYALSSSVSVNQVLAANLQFSYISPAWWVLATGLAVTVLGTVRSFGKMSGPRWRQMSTATARRVNHS